VPAEQDSLQQSVYAMHVAPAIRHLPGGTGIFEPTSPPASVGFIDESPPPPPVSVGDIESVPPSPVGVELSRARGLVGLLFDPLPPPPQPAAVRTLTQVIRKAARMKRESFMSHPVRRR
jgi:hypothetical protein